MCIYGSYTFFHDGKGKDMSKIKTSGTSSEPTVHAEKEFQIARQQAQMKAGEALFREASQKISEQREAAQSGDTDEGREQDQPKDTAQLSDVHLRPPTGKAGAIDALLQWGLEMAGEDWEAFLAWQPKPGISLPEQLQGLSKLYLGLLEAALKYAEGENLALQLERLDALLAQKLNAIMEQNLESLMALLEENGEAEVADGVRSNLYRQTAGKTLSPQAAHRLFAQGGPLRQGNARSFASASSSSFSGASSSFSGSSPSFSRASSSFSGSSPSFSGAASPSSGSLASLYGKGRDTSPSARQDSGPGQAYHKKSSASSSFSGEGMIYQSSRKQNDRFQQVYHRQQNSWKEQISQRNEVICQARKGIAGNTFRGSGAVSCSAKELERANRFAVHIQGRGNLFQNREITARNEEVTGLLAAVMTIKGQVYAGESGQSNSLVLSLQKAIGKMVDYYLRQKGAANVYYYTLSAYRQMKNPQKAVWAGQDYAYQRFCEKQKDPACQKSAAYSRGAGFFRALQNLSPEKEFALGTDILRRDWELFLRSMGTIKKSSYLSGAERYSPWGMLADPGVRHTDSHGNWIKFLFAAAVILLLGVLAVFIFRAGVW